MVYASIRFLAEWASPLTLVNFTLMGCASGTTLAAALGEAHYGQAALALTLAALAGRAASLWRNARLVPRSTLTSAIGIKHPQIRQRAMGFTGGSFNTREFFPRPCAGHPRSVKWFFLWAAFGLPALLLAAAPGFFSAGGRGLRRAVRRPAGRTLVSSRRRITPEPAELYYQAVS